MSARQRLALTGTGAQGSTRTVVVAQHGNPRRFSGAYFDNRVLSPAAFGTWPSARSRSGNHWRASTPGWGFRNDAGKMLVSLVLELG